MTTPEIWHRQFTRVAGPEIDTLMTVQQQEELKDKFGQFLKEESHWKLNTLDGILSYYYKHSPGAYNLDIFMIADGAHVDLSKFSNQGDGWFNPHCRIVGVVDFNPQSNDIIFIVGSDEVHNKDRFLQAASWDGGAFHYYAIEDIQDPHNRKWTYQANSFNAFTDGSDYDMSYLGPFNGHVNGACIMKEIHIPWYHWKTGDTDLTKCLSKKQVSLFDSLEYLSSLDTLSCVQDAGSLEKKVTYLISSWFQRRCQNHFKETNGQWKGTPANFHRWMAHLLLTTTINIAAGTQAFSYAAEDTERELLPADLSLWRAPPHLFVNSELLNEIKPFSNSIGTFTADFSYDHYQSAVKKLQLSLLQEWRSGTPPEDVTKKQLAKGILGGGKQTDSYEIQDFLVVNDNSEGRDICFTTLQASVEDATGVMNIPETLVSKPLLRCILLLDFYNPIYSWRRGVLMQYLPRTTTLVNGKYDMEAAFVAKIRASRHASETDSPETQFLTLYDNPPSDDAIRCRLESYLGNVTRQIKTPEGLYNYMMLAESRRRIYRPLPLDEFGLTLPYALALPTTWSPIEMAEDATVTPIPERGLNFLKCWTGTLHGFDPKLLPQDGCYAQARGGRCPRK
ncbi:hypothetical protein BJX61DRAFT_548777 [Aspergillus egyptiacus]|nr:hypothetical protein BJX61DRAFT_548777 [Aspergillus egyptiacus]